MRLHHIFLNTSLLGMHRKPHTHIPAPSYATPPASGAKTAPSAADAVRPRASTSAATSPEYCDAPCGKPKRLVRDSTLALQHGHSVTVCEPHSSRQQKQWPAQTQTHHQTSEIETSISHRYADIDQGSRRCRSSGCHGHPCHTRTHTPGPSPSHLLCLHSHPHSPQGLRAVEATHSKHTLHSAASSSCSILSAICFICCCSSCNCERRVTAAATNASWAHLS